MKKLTYILIIVFVFANITSCKDEFLETDPLDKFSEDAVWNDPALVQAFVNNIYFGIPHGFSNQMMASLTDESMYNADFGSSNVTKSLVEPSNYYTWDINWTGQRYRGMIWNNQYKYIRSTNLFFERIEEVPFDATDEAQAQKQRLIGEVHFLRAHLYQNLLSIYGGVPLITKAYGLKDDFLVPRNTFEECINFIVEECDKAAAILPVAHQSANKGRATKGAALALKGRVLLHAASELFHSTSWQNGYAHPELVGYVNGNRQSLYQAAKDAAKAVIDLDQYSLFRPNPSSAEEATKNYGDIFLTKENSEDIFVRYFLQKTDNDWDGYNPGLYNNPNGYHGWGSNTPLQQFVDKYEMIDGSEFNWSNPAHAANPYDNRDPRFYASILYEGAKWRQRPSDVVANDPAGIIQVGYWQTWDAAKNDTVVIAGLDTRKGPIEDWNGTYTGYYLRKFIDPNVDAQYVKQDLPWRYIRYTEVLLNYAEACLGLGEETEAKEYINKIRQRAFMPDITSSGEELIEDYRNERSIELAFEDHRYFDVRRWMIAPQTLENAKGVEIIYPLLPDKTTSAIPKYKIISVQDRAWLDRAYFLPIKLDEINNNPSLVQNPLYK